MGKNKKDLLDRLADKIEAQGERLKRLISVFYPDGVRTEFASIPQVAEYIMSLPTLQRISEDKDLSEKFTNICEESYETANRSVHITLGGYYNFHGYSCIGFNACIMFKATPDGTPIYLKDELQPNDARPQFLVDGENKEAYLILDNDGVFNWRGDSFIKLSEIHIILYRTNLETDNGLCFTISFSQGEEKYFFERIYDSNISLLENLLMCDVLNDDEGKLTDCMDSQPKATSEALEQLTTDNDDNENPPPKKRGKSAKNKSNVKVEIETETVTPSESIPEATEMFELA